MDSRWGISFIGSIDEKIYTVVKYRVNQIAVNILCCLVLLGVFLSALYINSKSKLSY